MGAVFINYRREETAGEARALFNDLVSRFGENSVFMDVDNIALGRDFRQVIQQRLASCDLMLALIGKNWVGAKNQSGRRRLDDASDFVRLEIEAALTRNIPVTPVLLQGAQMPTVEELPESVRDFAYRNGFEISHNRWESDVQEMIKRLGLGTQRGAGTGSRMDAPAGPTPAESSSIEARLGGAGPALASRPTRKSWFRVAGALVAAIAVAGGGLLYYGQVAQEKEAKAEQAEVEGAKARAAAAEAQAAALRAEAGKARADAETANAKAAATQAEKDRAATARAANERVAVAQAERDRAAAAQAERDRVATAQAAERAAAAQAEKDRVATAQAAERAAAAQAERDRVATAQAAERAAAAQAAKQVGVAGVWHDQASGVTYFIQQSGNNFTLVGSAPGQGVVARGLGIINARNVVVKYSMRNAVGEAALTLSQDGTELRGYYRLSTGEAGQAYLRR